MQTYYKTPLNLQKKVMLPYKMEKPKVNIKISFLAH